MKPVSLLFNFVLFLISGAIITFGIIIHLKFSDYLDILKSKYISLSFVIIIIGLFVIIGPILGFIQASDFQTVVFWAIFNREQL